MLYLENTTDTQTIFVSREIQSIENISPITLDSNYYTKVEVDVIAQRSLEQSKEYTNNLANEYYDIAEEYIDNNIERLENRIDELENNGGGSSGGNSSVVRIVAMDEILSVGDFNRIYHNTNNELFELQFQYSNNNNIKTFTILTKEWDSSMGIETIICFDFMKRYKYLKYSFDDTTIYMESSSIDSPVV